MHVLVTGNQGYVGSMLTGLLLERGYRVTGLDTGYYAGCEFSGYRYPGLNQIRKDIRSTAADDLRGVNAVMHLAALSNDPLGAFDPGITEAINFKATVNLARVAKASGVSRFVYASSCSLYGIAGEDEVTEVSTLAPVTALMALAPPA